MSSSTVGFLSAKSTIASADSQEEGYKSRKGFQTY